MASGGGAVELIPADEFSYWNFFLDWGPLSLGNLYRFCRTLNFKLKSERRLGKAIYVYSGPHAHKRTNAAFLLSAWLLLYGGRTPEQAFAPFQDVFPPFPPFHDASPCVCTFDLFIPHCLNGLQKARRFEFFNFNTFDVEEYEHYEQVENGDLNWLVDGKILAFAGPHNRSEMTREGYRTLTPRNYIPYFKKHNVTLVVRLNKKYYDERLFLEAGIDHLEAYFLDGSVPPPNVIRQFIAACEATPGAVAVHCKAGLGRTGTCIGCYIMKHYSFTAAEAIGWMRICRPGSVIGPQQHYLERMEGTMHREGVAFRQRAGIFTRSRRAPGGLSPPWEAQIDHLVADQSSGAGAAEDHDGGTVTGGGGRAQAAVREFAITRQRGDQSRSSAAASSGGRMSSSQVPRPFASSIHTSVGDNGEGKVKVIPSDEGPSPRRSNLNADLYGLRKVDNSRCRRKSTGSEKPHQQQAPSRSPLESGGRGERRGGKGMGAFGRMETMQLARHLPSSTNHTFRGASVPCERAANTSAAARAAARAVAEEAAAVASKSRTTLDVWDEMAQAWQRGEGEEGWAWGGRTQGDYLLQQRSRR